MLHVVVAILQKLVPHLLTMSLQERMTDLATTTGDLEGIGILAAKGHHELSSSWKERERVTNPVWSRS